MSSIFITESIIICDICNIKKEDYNEGWLWYNKKDICPSCCVNLMTGIIHTNLITDENLEDIIDESKINIKCRE